MSHAIAHACETGSALQYHVLSVLSMPWSEPMVWKLRRENLVSQHIEVALVYREMLGVDEAIDYLERERVPREIVERVLFTEDRRPSGTGTPDKPANAPYIGCRRRNRVHDAIVEAALKIEKKLGKHMALTLLREEEVPESVAARVIAQEPGQLRTRKPAS